MLEIGKGTLKAAQGTSDKTKFHNAIKWIQKAFAVVEHCEDTGETSLGDLKVIHVWLIGAYTQV